MGFSYLFIVNTSSKCIKSEWGGDNLVENGLRVPERKKAYYIDFFQRIIEHWLLTIITFIWDKSYYCIVYIDLPKNLCWQHIYIKCVHSRTIVVPLVDHWPMDSGENMKYTMLGTRQVWRKKIKNSREYVRITDVNMFKMTYELSIHMFSSLFFWQLIQ